MTNEKTFVSVEHQGKEFFVSFDVECSNQVFMRLSIPYFRVIASLVRYAVNYLEPNSPLAASLQGVLFDVFDQLLRLVAKHPDMVKSFENSPK